jgi:hypothetical protein
MSLRSSKPADEASIGGSGAENVAQPSRLPTELVWEIFSYLCDTKKATLLSCMLACRHYHAIGEPHLLRAIVPFADSKAVDERLVRIPAWTCWLEAAERDGRGTMVRRLELRVTAVDYDWRRRASGSAKFLELCPRAYSVGVTILDAAELAELWSVLMRMQDVRVLNLNLNDANYFNKARFSNFELPNNLFTLLISMCSMTAHCFKYYSSARRFQILRYILLVFQLPDWLPRRCRQNQIGAALRRKGN